ncbi:hypothetical protein VAE055_320126 [Vibrio aestuarianus]|nr:hypothetical protein VAE032_220126 [Vibrio aestuarianus]CAH8183081.1 hypothetical protein VAE055_320126 [Vibrio aestuarianus]CAH8183177.1 hypothetical protein VAE128_420126 [Vibrio aestuarianus]
MSGVSILFKVNVVAPIELPLASIVSHLRIAHFVPTQHSFLSYAWGMLIKQSTYQCKGVTYGAPSKTGFTLF